MAFDLTLVTPTADQPTGIALCEGFMRSQTVWGHANVQWIVADDGEAPATLTMGQRHLVRQRKPGCSPAESLCLNLLAALPLIEADRVVFIEHDDFYGPKHLEEMGIVLSGENVMIAGDPRITYYHVAGRCWRDCEWPTPALCQTGFKVGLLPALDRVVRRCLGQGSWHVDLNFWGEVPAEQRCVYRQSSVVGIKGLPGRPGIGLGHRPAGWTEDPQGATLRKLVGAMADSYLALEVCQ